MSNAMPCEGRFVTAVGGVLWLLAASISMAAAPPSDLLLPATTRAYIAAENYAQLKERWEKTGLAAFLHEPNVQIVYQQIQRQPGSLWSELEQITGATIDELDGVVDGRASAALVELEDRNFAAALLLETGKKADQAQALIATADARQQQRGYTASDHEIDGTSVRLLEKAGDEGTVAQTALFLKDGMLVIADDLKLAERILGRWSGSVEGGLASLAGYRESIEQCAKAAGDVAPDFRWYIDPVAVSRVDYKPDPDLEGADDPARYARKHGFDAAKGIGGFVSFSTGGCDLLHRTFIYAPPPYTSSMKIFSFPACDFSTLDWVRGDVSSYSTINMDLVNAFDNFSALFDDLVADGIEGTFEDLKADLKADDGPRVDLRKDLMEHLGNRITVMGQYVLPVSATSEGTVMAIEVKDEKAIASALHYLFRDDPGVERLKVEGYPYDLWKIGSDSQDDAEISFSSSALMVASGHLLLFTNSQFAKSFLRKASPEDRIARQADFQRVIDKLKEFDAEGASMRVVSWMDRDFFTTYELLRKGRIDEAESLYAQLLSQLDPGNEKGEAGGPAVEYDKLPEFEQVKKHFGLVGIYGKNREHGWLIEGFILPKQP